MDALHYKLLLILSLLFAIFALYILSNKLNISFPVFLVIGGLVISEIPHIPHIAINPELIFLIFLPPLLYDAAWNISWHQFWKRRRTIGLLAFGLVIFTACIVAMVTSSIIPGFTLALGFLLGGIISPTDAVSAISVLKTGSIPKRAQTVLEGESLVNDAGSLIVFRFALAAIITSQFNMEFAIRDFFVTTIMGTATGVIIAFIFYRLYRILPDIASVDASLTFMIPYIMYVAAEYFDYSGVMAVVSGGLFLSYRSHEFLKFDSRIQAANVWQTVSFLLNGAVFILIGLQLPFVIGDLTSGYSLDEAVIYGLLISVLIMVVRIGWVFATMFIPRMLSSKIRKKENNPGWRTAFLISWGGMRGVVSLASALSLPLTLSDGSEFPHRNLILFITFVVILFTLIVQGLTLPLVVKKLKITDTDALNTSQEQEDAIRAQLYKASSAFLQSRYPDHIPSLDMVNDLMEYERVIASEVIAIQRKELVAMRRDARFDHELLRRHETKLDFEEARINSYYRL